MPSDLRFKFWYVIVGMLLLGMALSYTLVKRLPLTTSLAYLAVGLLLGPLAAGMIGVEPLRWTHLLERVTEVAVIVSLFSAGLKLRVPLADRRWWLPVRLASASMVLTVALIALVGVWLLGLPLGAAVLLGAILAPTDPVLASDVQVEHPWDRDRLRFALTAEAGLNDGIAFPFVMLGLGLLNLHELGDWGWRWLAVDVLWAIVGGLSIGVVTGTAVSHLVLYLRRTHREAVGLDDFLSLGLLALCYGLALLAHTYGFLAAFAAGLAMRRIEVQSNSGSAAADASVNEPMPAASPDAAADIATHPEKAPAYMAQSVLSFNQQLERILEFAVVILLGGMLSAQYFSRDALWFVPLLFLVIRPVAVLLGLIGTKLWDEQRELICWFGVRGVGSVYYLMFALDKGVPEHLAVPLMSLSFCTVAASIAVHGMSVTPLMNRYQRFVRKRRGG